MRLRMIIPANAARTAVRYFFLAIAVVCLGLYGYAYLERVLYQTYESREFDRTPDRRRRCRRRLRRSHHADRPRRALVRKVCGIVEASACQCAHRTALGSKTAFVRHGARRHRPEILCNSP